MIINRKEITSVSVAFESKQFHYAGCENCANGLGNDVYECKAYRHNGKEMVHYDIYLCDQCICAYYNGDELDDACKNKFKI